VPKKPKVVSIDQEKSVLSAEHEETTRVIACIGGQRFAFDFLTRVTRLPPSTGNRPGHVLRIKSRRRTTNREIDDPVI
jgi:hypothetical protein